MCLFRRRQRDLDRETGHGSERVRVDRVDDVDDGDDSSSDDSVL